MGQATGRNSSLKETQILNMKQKEIMHYFREGLCNLLVATSVLVTYLFLLYRRYKDLLRIIL